MKIAGLKLLCITSATRQVRQQWFSVGIFPLVPSSGLTGNRPQSAPACSFNRCALFEKTATYKEILSEND